jgi:hypothetical protein
MVAGMSRFLAAWGGVCLGTVAWRPPWTPHDIGQSVHRTATSPACGNHHQCVAQTSDIYLWLGTPSGVVRFEAPVSFRARVRTGIPRDFGLERSSRTHGGGSGWSQHRLAGADWTMVSRFPETTASRSMRRPAWLRARGGVVSPGGLARFRTADGGSTKTDRRAAGRRCCRLTIPYDGGHHHHLWDGSASTHKLSRPTPRCGLLCSARAGACGSEPERFGSVERWRGASLLVPVRAPDNDQFFAEGRGGNLWIELQRF